MSREETSRILQGLAVEDSTCRIMEVITVVLATVYMVELELKFLIQTVANKMFYLFISLQMGNPLHSQWQ